MNSEFQPNKEIRYSILKKYFEDKASDEEKKLVNYWLNTPENSFILENSLGQLWKDIDIDINAPDIDLNALLDKTHHEINLARKKEKNSFVSSKSGSSVTFSLAVRNIARIAAILLLPLMGYVGWEIYYQKMWIKNQADIVYNEIICPLGARSHFELPDGTKGSLNNGSWLKYPVKFSGEFREVELVGEAFFNVYQCKDKPFIIHTNGLGVKVLGTRLNIYSYPGENYQEFTLESGSIELIQGEKEQISVAKMKPGQHVVYRFNQDNTEIQLEATEKDLLNIDNKHELDGIINRMKPGQRVVYKLNNGNMEIKFDKKTEQYTAWKEGKLILRDDPMPNLLKRIERWYNVKFNILDESINEFTYWATFEEENLDQVLHLLSLTGPIKFKKYQREKMTDGTYKIQEIDVMLNN